MNHKIAIISIILPILCLSCDKKFEAQFYKHITIGHVNATKSNNSNLNTFDLSSITDFEWDSVLFIRGNESVPVLSEEVEPILKRPTTDMSTNRHRFYFLTPDKEIIIKELRKYNHTPSFYLEFCMNDSLSERYWLSKSECIFILKSNSSSSEKATVFLFPQCKTLHSPDSIKIKLQ